MRRTPTTGPPKRRVNHVHIAAALTSVLSCMGKDPPHKECNEAAETPLRGCSRSANERDLYPTALIHYLILPPFTVSL